MRITYPKDGTTYMCSVGFMVSDGTNKYVVTSGHCRPDISTYFNQGTTNLGQMPFKHQGGNSDVGIIGGGPSNVTYQGGKIYLTSTTSGKYEITQNASEDVVGEVVRMSGASTATNSEQMGTITNKNFSVSVDGYNYTKLRLASYTSVGGDSGGTVYNGNKLKGINMGHSGTSAFYCQLEYVLIDLSAITGKTINILF
ncbi:hypothetical protein [Paenibacillus sp. CF384]|uniref:hypothetical protein n=1 Tax=Paenibacillus sp. CF384 TaxID=1884382 RepID=UPI00115F9A84|nr:hypothetical protein [Paenibacillus sp. CF384]